MKKTSIILMAALAFGGALTLSSCADEKGFVDPEVNPQLPVMTDQDLVVSNEVPEAVNLIELNNEAQPLVMGKVSKCENLPEGYTLKFKGTLAREEAFEHTADFDLDLSADGVISITADAFEGAYTQAMGKSAKPKTVYYRVAAYAEKGEEVARMGGLDVYFMEGKTLVTPFDLGIEIEDGYGLLGTINGWSVADAVPFSNGGVSGIDNPIFTLTVNITAADADAGWWWKVVPASTIATGNWVDAANAAFGVLENGSDALDGNLVPRTDTWDCGAGCVKTPGIYTLTIDMENQSYTFTPLYSLLYVPGDMNGWNFMNAAVIGAPVGGTEFQGLTYLKGGFKFVNEPDWNGINYGFSGEAGKLSTESTAGNISVRGEGLFYAKVDTEKLTYTCTPIQHVSLIGDFNNWGGDLEMTSSDYKIYSCDLTVAEGETWKVRFNFGWDINLGGDPSNLSFGGDNISVPAGTYTVILDLTTLPYTITLY